ncbi:FMN reductase (NADPH) [Planctomycetes bacterium Pla163]|uniref:FMN reductase (NADPH) n=1 Tax=Rohdeia mirabilis TaxID=2528008 RepID=A0A518D1F5_9BACT|nr:FMN reductase (NADPH) [Planctomycetes bacterium Pla163]
MNDPRRRPPAADVLRLLASHVSVRGFARAPLEEGLLANCVAAAQRAATSSNVQAYSLIRVTDTAERATLAELCGGQAQIAEAAEFCVVCADLRRDDLVARAAGGAVVANLEAFLLATVDASLFAQNLVVACEAHDLGTCYIGGLRNRIDEVDRLLELPRLVLPLFGLCIGQPATRNDVKPRLATDAVLHEGRYPSDAAVLASVRDYDAALAPYFAARGTPQHTWSGSIARKFHGALRPHLWAYYRSKGVELDLA